MSRARVSAACGHDLISLPEVVGLDLRDNSVLCLPAHVIPLLSKENGFSHRESIGLRHENSPVALIVAITKVAAFAACAISSR